MVTVCCISMSALDATASDTTRWGVTTNKKLEKHPSTAIDHSGLEAKPAEGNHTNKKSPAGKTENRPDTVVKDAGNALKSQPAATDSSTEAMPGANALQDPASPSMKPITDGKETVPSKNPVTKALMWTDENQKMTCNEYLKDLRAQFLQTRHYSIQGAPCKTKEHATAFLQTRDKCTTECPDGFLNKNGYTTRILRNITYLEKIGKDRCENTTKSPPMPHTK